MSLVKLNSCGLVETVLSRRYNYQQATNDSYMKFSITCLSLFTCFVFLSTSGRVSEAPTLLGGKRYIQFVYTARRSGKAVGGRINIQNCSEF